MGTNISNIYDTSGKNMHWRQWMTCDKQSVGTPGESIRGFSQVKLPASSPPPTKQLKEYKVKK